MAENKCDHCKEPIGITYYSLGPMGNATWEFCSEYCKNQWQDQNEDTRNRVTDFSDKMWEDYKDKFDPEAEAHKFEIVDDKLEITPVEIFKKGVDKA